MTGPFAPPPPRRRRAFAGCLLACSLLLVPDEAAAVQPLRAFLVAAEHANYDVRQSTELVQQRQQEARAATGRLLPSLSINGAYTRNQYAAQFVMQGRVLRLAPQDQLDGALQLTVPVLDVTNWAKRAAGLAQARAAAAQGEGGKLAAARQVAQHYYALRGSEGVLRSAQNSSGYAERALKLVRDRHEVGSASTLDVARAESDRAEAEQQVAAAELQVTLGRRQLETLTGLAAEPAGEFPEVDLADEAPLASWLAAVGPGLPAVATATAQQQAAHAGDRAATFGYLPTLNLTAAERVTNASGLNGGHTFVWVAKANLSWQFDASLTPTQRAQAHASRTARVRSEQVARQAADAVYEDWARVRANQAQSRAARVQVRATKLAETLALDKSAAGVVTQLDVVQARRDAFAAEVNRIQADANLLYYRTLLRLDCASSVAALEEPEP